MARELDGWTVKGGLVLLLVACAMALVPAGTAKANDFHVRLLLSYVNGMQDLADQYEDNIEVEETEIYGFDFVEVDTFVWPIGISVFPYYQWDSGLTFGAGFGPFMYLLAEGSEDYTHWQVPASLNVGYVFWPDNPVSLYVRGGPSYHFAGGDYHDESKIGFTGAVGLEFAKWDRVVMGVEASYDSAEVELEDWTGPAGDTVGIKAAEFSVGLFIAF